MILLYLATSQYYGATVMRGVYQTGIVYWRGATDTNFKA